MKIIFAHLARAVMLLALPALAGCAGLAARTAIPIVQASVASPAPKPSATPLPPIQTVTPTPEPTSAPTSTVRPSATPGCGDTAGRTDTGKLPSRVLASGSVAYVVYFPPCYDTRQRYPVVYLMHGTPFDERHWLDLGVTQAADQAIASRRLPPFIIILPRGDLNGTFGNTSGGDGSWEQVMVDELIPYVDTTYNTVPAKDGRAIGGISRGAVWALEIAFRHPDLFAAVGGHSPALSVNLAPPVFDPIDIAQTDQAEALKSLRILLDAGDTDWSLQGAAELHALLDQRSVDNTFSVQRGSHIADYWASQMDTYVAFYGSTFLNLSAQGVAP